MPRADYEKTLGILAHLKDDEPIFILRGQDLMAPSIVRAIASIYEATGKTEMAISAEQTAGMMDRWEGEKKMPD